MDIHEYLAHLGGVARTGQLLASGFTRTDLRSLPDAGVTQPRRGVFMLQDANPALVAAIKHNARASCASAAGLYGLWLRKPPHKHHLTCNHGHDSGFVRHRTSRFEPHATLPLAAIEDVVLHGLSCLPPPASTALATSAIRLHDVPLDLLKEQLLGDRSGPVLAALRQLDLRSESIVEVDARHLFLTNGISFEQQVQLDGIGRVDFLIEDYLIVEVDGHAFHSGRHEMLRDRARNNSSTVQGFAVLRYMPEVIWFEPDRVVAEIQAVLALRRSAP